MVCHTHIHRIGRVESVQRGRETRGNLDDVRGDREELLGGNSVGIIKMIRSCGQLDQLHEFGKTVLVLRKEDGVVIVTHLFGKRHRNIDFDAGNKTDSLFVAVQFLLDPRARKTVFRGRNRVHTLFFGKIDILRERGTRVKKRVVTMEMVNNHTATSII